MRDPLFRWLLEVGSAFAVAMAIILCLADGSFKPIGRLVAAVIETAEGERGHRIAGRGR